MKIGQILRWVYNSLRLLIVLAILLTVLGTAVVYIAISLPATQSYLCKFGERELSKLMGAEVRIGEVMMTPFNRVMLRNVEVLTSPNDTALKADWIGAGINLTQLIGSGRIVINYAELIGLDLKVWSDSAGAPLNIRPIIEAFKPKDKNKPPTPFDLRINTVVIRKSTLSYDVGHDIPEEGCFDPRHIRLNSFRADLRIPRLKNDDFEFDLRRIAFEDRSGFELKNLSGKFIVTSCGLRVSDFAIALPNSEVKLDEIQLNYLSWDELRRDLPLLPISISTLTGSHVTPADLVQFAPALDRFRTPASLDISITGCVDSLLVRRLAVINTDEGWWTRIDHAHVDGIATNPSHLYIDAFNVHLGASSSEAVWVAGLIPGLSPAARQIIRNAGDISFDGLFEGEPKAALITASLMTSTGRVGFDFEYDLSRPDHAKSFKFDLLTDNFDLATLFAGQKAALANFGNVILEAGGEITLLPDHRLPLGNVKVDIPTVQYKGHTYTGLTADIDNSDSNIHATLMLDNPDVKVALGCEAVIDDDFSQLLVDINLDRVNLAQLNLTSKYPDHYFSARAHGELSGKNIDNIDGNIALKNIRFVDPQNNGLKIKSIDIVARSDEYPHTISLNSDMADGTLSGNFHWATLPKVLKNMAATYLPALVSPVEILRKENYSYNNFAFNLNLKTTSPLEQLIKLPVSVVAPISLSGDLDETTMSGRLNLDAPYLVQKDKIIEQTSLDFSFGKSPMSVMLTTRYPMKQGVLDFNLKSVALNDRLSTGIEWKVERERDYSGEINLLADFKRLYDNTSNPYSLGPDDSDSGSNQYRDTGGKDRALTSSGGKELKGRGELLTMVTVESGEAVFNDTVWEISCPLISITKKRIGIDSLRITHLPQYLVIDGVAAAEENDSLTIDLRDMDLDYIFETLNIPNVIFGGRASGIFHGARLLSKSPSLYTPNLHVNQLKYNHSLLGNADISSYWEDGRKAVVINATVDQPNGCKSKIEGRIMPMADSLDFHFDADKIRVGFMKPYMEAFAEDIDGYASGNARLWGSFKYIDMVGDIYAQDVSLKLGFTGCTYWATDSVHLRPGRINLDGILLRDINNHTAILNGWVTHKCFKEPQFNFHVEDARELLVYDMKKNIDYPWWGTVYGNGSAEVASSPQDIMINVHMTTASNTSFFFEISDRENANDYNFITFRDRDQSKKDSILAADPTPLIIRQLRERQNKQQNNGTSTPYVMNFSIDVTPFAQLNLIMDPDGGDNIKARGSGHMDFSYNSGKDDMSLTGVYTLDEGSYNFTFQDIILKDFTIQKGSQIAFTGDPYNANLNIHAAYDLTANLSDLDESFLQEKEISNPNVKVRAMLDVLGNMQQPDFSFDIQLPGLSDAVQSKLRSIVSTEDMMNRQVLYLLAFNRFYTPEYMAASRGNELVSFASSTLSSQLGNVLGQLSDKFSIAPNVRSDRGGFSDVEVDVALSSQLLDNRLILNGNFGYRDKSLNTNSFVGDFDIEYILNKSGNLRLKAYNRYNDQNYYLRNAQTTQGVGVVIRRDFDSMFSFLRPLRRKLWPHKDKEKEKDKEKNNKEKDKSQVREQAVETGKAVDTDDGLIRYRSKQKKEDKQ